jgi:hypothetical protein
MARVVAGIDASTGAGTGASEGSGKKGRARPVPRQSRHWRNAGLLAHEGRGWSGSTSRCSSNSVSTTRWNHGRPDHPTAVPLAFRDRL